MPKETIQLSDHFTYSRLLRFVLPCIGTMLFTSIYGIVDGLCVSNFVGKTAFAAVNLIMPVPMLVGTVGFMLGTGGSAIVGITLGEGDKARADHSETNLSFHTNAVNIYIVIKYVRKSGTPHPTGDSPVRDNGSPTFHIVRRDRC